MSPTRLAEPVFRAVDLVEPQARDKEIAIERIEGPGDLRALCDAELIYQVALNLVMNAIQVLGPGGRIAVEVLDPGDGLVGFEVRDDGPGIPDEIREKVFLPFVSERKGGVGLGLTFVKRVIHEHRGRIGLGDTGGPGTCFRVEIPEATS